MSERVRLGLKGSDCGLWVSAPGKDVSSTLFDDLLVDTNRINTQPLMKGVVTDITLMFDDSLSQSPTLIVGYPYYMWADGYSVLKMDIPHNLGFIPLCHLSILTEYGGYASPFVYIDSSKIRLYYKENWAGYSGAAAIFPHPSSRSFEGELHYTLFRQST